MFDTQLLASQILASRIWKLYLGLIKTSKVLFFLLSIDAIKQIIRCQFILKPNTYIN